MGRAPHVKKTPIQKRDRKTALYASEGGRQRPGFPNFNPDRIFRSKTFSCSRLCNATVGSVVSPYLSTPFDFPDNHFQPCQFYVETFQFTSLCQKLMTPA